MSQQPWGHDEPHRVPLAVLGENASERADAARNRRRILEAADEIVSTRGVAALSMDEVARAANVGVGTVYRRFGDRSALAFALLDERERELQAAFLYGPPPLGPGSPAIDRIRAFLHTLLDRVEAQPSLLVVAEADTPTARYANSAYAVHRAHLAGLLAVAQPDADAEYLADALLAPLAASLVVHQRRDREMSVERIKAGLDSLLDALCPPDVLAD